VDLAHHGAGTRLCRGGADGSFPFYGYHGYWPLDFTRIDPNFGDEAALRTLVAEAHKRGIRVLLDVIMNHVGYANLADLQDWGPRLWCAIARACLRAGLTGAPRDVMATGTASLPISITSPPSGASGGDWVRADLPGYPKPGSDEVTTTIGGLPDLLTESTAYVACRRCLNTRRIPVPASWQTPPSAII